MGANKDMSYANIIFFRQPKQIYAAVCVEIYYTLNETTTAIKCSKQILKFAVLWNKNNE